jgi:nicotinamide N-methyltransferase
MGPSCHKLGQHTLFPYDDPFTPACPSSLFFGPPSLFSFLSTTNPGFDQLRPGGNNSQPDVPGSTITYHGVCLAVWYHADAECSVAIRHTLESAHCCAPQGSLLTPKIQLSQHITTISTGCGLWMANGGAIDGEMDMDDETDSGISKSNYEVRSI